MNKKIIAKTELSIIGGKPEVFAYYNNDKTKKIDIFSSKERPQSGVTTFATIGLSETDFGLISDNKKLRIEFIGACNKTIVEYPNMIATAAFNFMESEKCTYGSVAFDVISEYLKDTEMKHFYLMTPFLWEDLKTIVVDDNYVTWLLCIPISEREREFLETNGSDALEDEFEKNDINIFDIYRKSVV